jgi:peptidoglycan/LPS O-acetylase OafA/YrhL
MDGVRALAALAVVVTHVGFESGRYLYGASGSVIGRLDIGVALFFVLSGFLLGRPFALWSVGAGPRPGLRRYAARRAVRVLPAYWLALTAALLLLRPVELRSAVDVVWQYALAQTYGQYRLLPGFSHVWSLSTEVAFYAVLPLIGGLLVTVGRRREHAVRRQLTVLAVGAVASLCVLVLVHAGVLLDDTLAPQWLPARFDWFAIGLALAVLTTPAGARSRPGRVLQELARAPGWCWAAALLVFWIACTPVAGERGFVSLTAHEALTREVLYGVAALLLLVPVVAGPRTGGAVRTALQSRPAVLLGQISYGVFLWHLVVLEVLQRALGLQEFRFPFVPVLLAVLVVTFAVATVSWVLVERPLLRLVDRRLAARPGGEQGDRGGAQRGEHEQLRHSGVGAG